MQLLRKRSVVGLASLILFVMTIIFFSQAQAATGKFNYQGSMNVEDEPFTGTGYFKLAIVNSSGATLWSNDSTSVNGSEPASDIEITVTDGFYSIDIGGDETDALDTTLFDNNSLTYLRVWFNDGTNGFSLLTPDIELTSTIYSFVAQSLQGYTPDDFLKADDTLTASSLSSGAVTSAKIADSAVTASKISAFSNSGRTFTLGDGTSNNVTLSAGIGSSNAPALRYNSTSSQWELSNNGTSFSTISTATATDFSDLSASIIDATSTEAFLVRKDADAADVFTVDTTNARTFTNGPSLKSSVGTTTNFYVNASTGSDANNGLASGTPFLTIQKALDTAGAGTFGGSVTINVADGTYAENLFISDTLGQQKDTTYGNTFIDIVGNETTPSNVVIQPASSNAIRLRYATLRLRGVRVSGAANSSGITAISSTLYLKNMDFNGIARFIDAQSHTTITYEASTAGSTWTAGASNAPLISLSIGSQFSQSSNLTLVAGAATTSMVSVFNGSRYFGGSGTLTLTGTAGVTQTGFAINTYSNVTLQGNTTISNITGTPATNAYQGAAIRVLNNSGYFHSSSASFTLNTVTNAFFLNKGSSIETSGNITTSYTSVTNKIVMDHSCTIDSPDNFDIASTEFKWTALRNSTAFNFNEAFKAGTAVASAASLVLSNDGNIVHITGTTQIDLIDTTSIFYPYYILIFDGALIVRDNQAASGNNKPILLSGTASLSATAGSTLTLVYDSSSSVWREVGRAIR